jgi:hypothetical protein
MSKAELGILKTIHEVKARHERHEEKLKQFFRDNIDTYNAAGGRDQLVRDLDIQRHKFAEDVNRTLANATRTYWKELKAENEAEAAKKKAAKKKAAKKKTSKKR